MAKDNLFLGFARGKIGDVVFSRVGGKQVSRARNRSPKNPQTVAQMIQRVAISTVGKMYSLTQELTDHSFEGFDGSALNQQRFMQANVAALRDKMATVIEYPTWETLYETEVDASFSFPGEYLPRVNPYIISEGSLPALSLLGNATAGYEAVIRTLAPSVPAGGFTYNDICAAFGVNRGDQVTFIAFTTSNPNSYRIEGMIYARVILEPASGDMTTVFLAQNGAVNSPNVRNSGNITFEPETGGSGNVKLDFTLTDAANATAMGYAVIVSRQENGKWLRSASSLMPTSEGVSSIGIPSLAEAVQALMKTDPASGLYLNQAQ